VDDLIGLCSQVISDDALFVLVNSYTTGLSASTVGYLLELHFASKFGGKVEASEIGIPVSTTGGTLPAGSSARWMKK
jgi:23S rRNA (cytosine1962-C5)-methyltransferase